eukprot:7260747-Pyramimonas_sp.AAC.1
MSVDNAKGCLEPHPRVALARAATVDVPMGRAARRCPRRAGEATVQETAMGQRRLLIVCPLVPCRVVAEGLRQLDDERGIMLCQGELPLRLVLLGVHQVLERYVDVVFVLHDAGERRLDPGGDPGPA